MKNPEKQPSFESTSEPSKDNRQWRRDKSSFFEAKDDFEVLGVPKTATAKEIGAVYRKLAMQYHPDKNFGDEESTEIFKKIQEAYENLSGIGGRQHASQRGTEPKTAPKPSNGTAEPRKETNKTTEALEELKRAWQAYANRSIDPGPEYYNSYSKETPDYINTQTKVVKALPGLDAAWDNFRKKVGLNVTLPTEYYNHLLRNQSVLWIEQDIRKINMLIYLAELLRNKGKQMTSEYFEYVWNKPMSSIESEVENWRY